MRQGVLGQVGHGAGGLLDHVVGGACTCGHAFVGDIGYVEELGLDFGLRAGKLIGEGLLLFLEHGHAFLCLFGFFATAFLHGFADCRGHAVELGGGSVVFELEFATEVIEGQHAGDGLGAVKALYGQTLYYKLGVGLYLL